MSTRHRQRPVGRGALCVALGFVCLAALSLRASESFRDDFTNPDPTNPDRDPVTWQLQEGNPLSIENGELILENNGFQAIAFVDNFTAHNLSMKVKLRLLQGTGTQGGVFLRSGFPNWQFYFSNLRSSDHLEYPRTADIWRQDTQSDVEGISTLFNPLDFDPVGDVMMQFQAVGDDLSLWVWPAGTDQPQEPIATAEDATWTDGTVGLGVADQYAPMHARMAVDYVEVTVFPTGDFNLDGTANIDDLNAMLAEGPIAAGIPAIPNTNDQFDLTGDGVIDNADADRWLAEAATVNGLASPYKRGDIDLDGMVDVSDFNLWNSHKFTSTLLWDSGDVNGDGVVDVGDFNHWNGNKFTSSDDASPVPEPSIGIVLLAAILLWRGNHVRR